MMMGRFSSKQTMGSQSVSWSFENHVILLKRSNRDIREKYLKINMNQNYLDESSDENIFWSVIEANNVYVRPRAPSFEAWPRGIS
jgi:hypothetical protein